jgi:RNA polymerase sigma-70 factor (ECF subfamily)
MANERKAQRLLYDRYAPVMLSVCRRYMGTSQAEDALQESFIRVFRYLVQYRHEGSFEGWLRRICVNTCIRLIQQSRRLMIEYAADNMPDLPVDPDALHQLQAEELLNLIDRLPDGYRTVFNLSIIEGYSHKEIGDLLGIGESSSRSQLTKARKYMQRYLMAPQKAAV